MLLMVCLRCGFCTCLCSLCECPAVSVWCFKPISIQTDDFRGYYLDPQEDLLYLNQLTLITRRRISMDHRSSMRIDIEGSTFF